jgi:hypothetical protein
MSSTRTLAAAVLGVLLAAALSACTIPSPGGATEATPTPSPTQAFALRIAPDDVVAELGPVPPYAEPSPERLEHLRRLAEERAWAGLSRQYPGMPRPDAALVEYVEPGQGLARVQRCIAERGAELPADGSADGSQLEANALATYVCGVQYPTRMQGLPTEEQTAYLYDYWTGFVVPCFADVGTPSAGEPPTREYFVENWPYQDWSPTPRDGGQPLTFLAIDQLDLMCPTTPEGLS